MTTPERLRHRQRMLGFFVLVLAIFTLAQATYLTVQDRAQNKCFQDRFTELSRVSGLRAGLAEEETNATAGVLGVYARAAGIVQDKPGHKLDPAQQRRLQKQLIARLVEYGQTTKRIQDERQQHPVPPYPVGTCGEKAKE